MHTYTHTRTHACAQTDALASESQASENDKFYVVRVNEQAP